MAQVAQFDRELTIERTAAEAALATERVTKETAQLQQALTVNAARARAENAARIISGAPADRTFSQSAPTGTGSGHEQQAGGDDAIDGELILFTTVTFQMRILLTI